MTSSLKKKINWTDIYDGLLLKISADYIDAKCWYTDHNFETIKEDKGTFLKNVRDNFRDDMGTSVYHGLCNLQKRLPLLAEHLIHECFDNKLLSKNKFSEIFINIYSYAEKDYTLFSNEITNDKLLKIFKYCNKDFVTNEEDRNYFQALPSEINIYRGTAGRTKDIAKNGVSWTLDRDKAIEFAEYNQDYYKTPSRLLIEGRVLKKNVVVYIHDSARYEHELIIDPADITNHKFSEFH